MNEVLSKQPSVRRRVKPSTAMAERPAALGTQPIHGEWCVGIVDAAEPASVTSGGMRMRARRAASCLLDPASGDSVACLRIAPDEVWIMAILQREEGAANVIRCTGDTRIVVDHGALALEASRTAVRTEQFELTAGKISVAAEIADVVGRQLNVIGTRLKLVGSMLSTVMDRVQHFSKHYLRTTDGMDRVSATHVECEASQLMRIEGEHTLVNGRELVKARGAQIHFG